jgi:hypothetical protein
MNPTYFLHPSHFKVYPIEFSRPEDGGSTFLQYVGKKQGTMRSVKDQKTTEILTKNAMNTSKIYLLCMCLSVRIFI